ncbi:MAG: DUF1830 domain-containing protein [Synechococcaceae cyanobacterium]|nr:DUF1830 domain-containing protein [Synechococcaceae cyanobacterium]
MDEAGLPCLYRNPRDRMVIVRCGDATGIAMERVLFPFESLGFTSRPGQRLQVWGSQPGGAELIETVAVEELAETGWEPALAGL